MGTLVMNAGCMGKPGGCEVSWRAANRVTIWPASWTKYVGCSDYSARIDLGPPRAAADIGFNTFYRTTFANVLEKTLGHNARIFAKEFRKQFYQGTVNSERRGLISVAAMVAHQPTVRAFIVGIYLQRMRSRFNSPVQLVHPGEQVCDAVECIRIERLQCGPFLDSPAFRAFTRQVVALVNSAGGLVNLQRLVHFAPAFVLTPFADQMAQLFGINVNVCQEIEQIVRPTTDNEVRVIWPGQVRFQSRPSFTDHGS